MSNSSIWPIDRTPSDVTTLGQSGPGSNGNEGASPSDCLVSYPGHSLGDFLPYSRDAVDVFFSPNWLGYLLNEPRNLNYNLAILPTQQIL